MPKDSLDWDFFFRDLRNLFLEGFLLHFRNLCDFFRANKEGDDLRYKNDGFEILFFEYEEIISNFRCKIGNREGGLIFDLNKRLAHPTTKRAREHNWNVDEMYALIEPLIVIIDNASPCKE